MKAGTTVEEAAELMLRAVFTAREHEIVFSRPVRAYALWAIWKTIEAAEEIASLPPRQRYELVHPVMNRLTMPGVGIPISLDPIIRLMTAILEDAVEGIPPTEYPPTDLSIAVTAMREISGWLEMVISNQKAEGYVRERIVPTIQLLQRLQLPAKARRNAALISAVIDLMRANWRTTRRVIAMDKTWDREVRAPLNQVVRSILEERRPEWIRRISVWIQHISVWIRRISAWTQRAQATCARIIRT